MADFKKGKWKTEKLVELRNTLKNSPLGKYQTIIDKIEAEYTTMLDSVLQTNNVNTKEDAENQLKSRIKRKKILFFVDKSMYLIDTANNVVKFHELPVDISGSSIDDGNENLYPDIDRDELLFLAKSVLGDLVSYLTGARVLKAILKPNDTFGRLLDNTISVVDFGEFDISKVFLKNHIIKVDYKDIDSNEAKERKYILYRADKIFDFALDDVWSSVKADLDSLNRTIFTRNNDTPVEFIWHKEAYSGSNKKDKTLEFRTGRDEEKIVSVLKRVDSEYVKFLDFGSSPIELVANYYSNYGTNASSVIVDLENYKKKVNAAYAFKNLKGYVLANETNSNEYQNMNIYSQEHKDDRLAFFQTHINIQVNRKLADRQNLEIRNSYYDTSMGIFIQHNNNGFAPIKNVVFVDGEYSNSVDRQVIYGYSNADTITATNSYDVYIEGGLGSDTIKTDSGNDTIYTNARINDKFDTETADTTNTVNSGAGNDHIYGSNGIDEINAQDGDDWLYGKKGDDILDGGKGIDHIFGGAGSDTINAESGENYIYTHTDSDTGEDLDTKNDTNTVDIKNATKNFIYGGRGIENITIDSGRSHIYTKENDDIVTISNGELNEIYLGAGSDTLSINGGNNNLVYTHTDGKNDIDKDTNEDTNTINITLGRNKIYGGKGIENITIQDGDNVIDTGDGDNVVTITGGKNNITLGSNNDTVVIDGGDNTINGGDGEDNITATSGKNHIDGGIGKDTITTGDGDDTLIGGADEDADELNGGAGDDSYFVDANDIINDSDHIGKVWFNSIARLTGGVETEPNSKTYKGGGYTYHLNGNTLQVRQDSTGKSITIKNYDQVKSSLGIVLANKVGLKIVDVTETEGDNKESKFANITVELVGEIVGDGCLEVFVTGNDNEPIKFTSGCTTQSYKYDISAYNDFAVNSEKTRIVAGLTPYLIRNLSDTKNTVSYDSEHSSYGNLKLVDNDTPVYLMVKGSSASEKAEQLSGKVSLSRSLKQGEYVTVNIAGKKIEFTSANSSEEFKITWTDDKTEEEDSKFYITPSYISSNATVYYKGKGGKCKIIDDDKDKDPNDPKNYDPIIIDLNKNGVIETTNIDYGRRFDLDNNGFKESVAWVGKNDALLAIDKNNNGTIDNGNELFTNANFSNGFENLKSYDTNNDGIIDNKDEIWDKLILWQDKDEKFANLNLLVA